MTETVEDIENAVKQLSPEQLKRFRIWYEKFDADLWDQQIEKDAKNGKIDDLAEAALADHRAGRSKKL